MSRRIDAHHHLWDLHAVTYPWLMAKGVVRFFGDPTPIQRDYLLEEFRRDAQAAGFSASVHIQVGASDGFEEAKSVQQIADANPDWPLVQVVFCDLTSKDLNAQLDAYQAMSTVRGVRQIVGRASGEDALTGTNKLLDNPGFLEGLREAGRRGMSFDLQLIPELMEKTATLLEKVPETPVALCHAGSPHDLSSQGLEHWSKQLIHLSDLDHVCCKLSGLSMFNHNWTVDDFAPIVQTCLDQFGASRCMFGSNFPVDSLHAEYGSLIRATELLVPLSNHAQVFGGTAESFYSVAKL